MRKCLRDAEAAWYAGHGDPDKVLSEINQVVATGVAAMEEHGVPSARSFERREAKLNFDPDAGPPLP